MRFSTSAIAIGLPLAALAAESPFEQYKAQFQNFLGQFGSYFPSPNANQNDGSKPAAPASKNEEKTMAVLTLNNWKDTLYEPVQPGATKPEEWWVFITGGNKTCYGHCGRAELAFNETAAKFATLPNTPHMAYLNCENQRVLCHAWSCGPGSIWIFDMLPPPAEVEIYAKRLNLSRVTSDDLVQLQASKARDSFQPYKSNWWHPIHGHIAEYGMTLPVGYFFWALNIIPNWLFMLVVSLISRTMMSRRMQNHMNRSDAAADAAAAAAAAAAANPGAGPAAGAAHAP